VEAEAIAGLAAAGLRALQRQVRLDRRRMTPHADGAATLLACACALCGLARSIQCMLLVVAIRLAGPAESDSIVAINLSFLCVSVARGMGFESSSADHNIGMVDGISGSRRLGLQQGENGTPRAYGHNSGSGCAPWL
jgi:hypothetical protein